MYTCQYCWSSMSSSKGQAVPGHGGLVCNVIAPVFVPSPTFSWQANLYESGFCSVCKMSTQLVCRRHHSIFSLAAGLFWVSAAVCTCVQAKDRGGSCGSPSLVSFPQSNFSLRQDCCRQSPELATLRKSWQQFACSATLWCSQADLMAAAHIPLQRMCHTGRFHHRSTPSPKWCTSPLFDPALHHAICPRSRTQQ